MQAVQQCQAAQPINEAQQPFCGWFESSRDLRAGLTVTEDADFSAFQFWASRLGAGAAESKLH